MICCAACDRPITESSGREPFAYCEQDFCDRMCAQRWAFARLPEVYGTARLARQFRLGLSRILIKSRGVGRQLALAALRTDET